MIGMKTTMKKGVTVMLVLVFMGVFSAVVGTLASYILTQAKVGRIKYAREQAFGIAEAGLEYYRWFLAHNPNDLQNGTGQPGPYTYIVNDPEGGAIGETELTIVGNTECGAVKSVDIISKGESYNSPTFKRTIKARYAQQSVIEYATIMSSNAWIKDDVTVFGKYDSNGGIRMDANANTDVNAGVVCIWLLSCA